MFFCKKNFIKHDTNNFWLTCRKRNNRLVQLFDSRSRYVRVSVISLSAWYVCIRAPKFSSAFTTTSDLLGEKISYSKIAIEYNVRKRILLGVDSMYFSSLFWICPNSRYHILHLVVDLVCVLWYKGNKKMKWYFLSRRFTANR